jgi:hypothetical protein
MSTSIPAVEDGQFDDAPMDSHPERSLRQYNYIDDTPLEQSEDSSEGDDDIHSEDLDDSFARVEDEDWEIAERGKKRESYTTIPSVLIFLHKILPNNTIVCDNILL